MDHGFYWINTLISLYIDEIGKKFLDLYIYMYIIWTTPLKFTIKIFLRSLGHDEKIYDWGTCFRAFCNWATCQERLEITELDRVS